MVELRNRGSNQHVVSDKPCRTAGITCLDNCADVPLCVCVCVPMFVRVCVCERIEQLQQLTSKPLSDCLRNCVTVCVGGVKVFLMQPWDCIPQLYCSSRGIAEMPKDRG